MSRKYKFQTAIHALVIGFVLFGLITDSTNYFNKNSSGSVWFHLVNYFSYFTVLSNIILAVSCLYLIINPLANSVAFRALRLNAIVCMLITAIIFNIFLRPNYVPNNLLGNIVNEISHVINPILALFSYLFFDPKPILSRRIVRLAITPPLIYTAYVFVRGYFTGFYPYYFLNIHKVGVLTACIFVVSSITLFLALSIGLSFIEKKMTKNKNHS